jgi:hypothetical protein
MSTDPNKQYSFEFDEQGANVVSEQIMDSYNSGFIDQGTAIADSNDFTTSES